MLIVDQGRLSTLLGHTPDEADCAFALTMIMSAAIARINF